MAATNECPLAITNDSAQAHARTDMHLINEDEFDKVSKEGRAQVAEGIIHEHLHHLHNVHLLSHHHTI